MKDVFVFGSLNMDLSIACERLPASGETLAGSGFTTTPGGKGANQAVAAARAGAPTHMIGAVGADAFGARMVAELEAAGVDGSGIQQIEGATTGVAVIVRSAGDNRIILDSGANACPRVEDVCSVLTAAARSGDIFLTQLECDYEQTFAALAEAHARGLITFFNPSPARIIPAEVWKAVDVVCLNETEAALICGIEPDNDTQASEVLAHIQALGPRIVALTLGARGSVVQAEGTTLTVTPPAVEVRDTTCAGDTYLGTLVAAIAQGAGWERALERANAASALATTHVGAQVSIPSAAEVDALM